MRLLNIYDVQPPLYFLYVHQHKLRGTKIQKMGKIIYNKTTCQYIEATLKYVAQERIEIAHGGGGTILMLKNGCNWSPNME